MSDLAEKVLTVIEPYLKDSEFPIWEATYWLLKAEIKIQEEDFEMAEQYISRSISFTELFQANESLARIYSQKHNYKKTRLKLEWLINNRGISFAELSDQLYGRPFNVLDWALAHFKLAELTKINNERDLAIKYHEALVTHWQHSFDDPIPKASISAKALNELTAKNAD